MGKVKPLEGMAGTSRPYLVQLDFTGMSMLQVRTTYPVLTSALSLPLLEPYRSGHSSTTEYLVST